MGWKVFFQMTQEQFKSKYEKGEKWGELFPALVRVTNATVESYYGAGIITDSPTQILHSQKMQHFVGAKTRLSAKYLVGFKAGAVGKAGIYISFYKDGEFSKDPEGYTYFGIAHTLSTAQQYDIVEKHEYRVETENAKITLYLDGTKMKEYTLEAPLQSFVYALQVPEVSGNLVFIVIYEVKAEYYDVLEDILNMMMSAFWWMMVIMMAIMVISMLVRAFRREKRVKEKEVKAGG